MPKTKNDPVADRQTVQIRFPADLLEAVDREAERLSGERGGEPVGRSEVIRMACRKMLMPEPEAPKRGRSSKA